MNALQNIGLTIAPFIPDDFDQWVKLWDDNNMGHSDKAVTTHTWSRLMDEGSSVNGLSAKIGNKIVGFLHNILHPVTGHLQPVCYMQDVYVDSDFRKQGIARVLIGELARTGMAAKWARIYWLAEADNVAAQALYKDLGVKLNFTLHALPTS